MPSYTYLITGGAGFIGSHLTQHLLACNHRVIVIDDLSSGKRDNLPETALFHHADAADTALLSRIIPTVNGVFHLAAIASVERSNREWLTATRCNLLLTVAVLEAIAKRDAPIPCVLASSAAVYGNNPASPLSETMQPTPVSAYGVDKYASEHHARIGSLIHHIPSAALRFFNVYGERQDPSSPYSGVISIFARALLANQPLSIYGDGMQQRDFIYVGDVCRIAIAAMALLHQQHTQNSPAPHYCLNVGTGIPTTIHELMQRMQHATDSTSPIAYHPARQGDIYQSYSDMNYTHQQLGIHAITPLQEGLRRTLAWVKEGL